MKALFSASGTNVDIPNATSVPVTWKLKDANGTVLKEASETLVAKASNEYTLVRKLSADTAIGVTTLRLGTMSLRV